MEAIYGAGHSGGGRPLIISRANRLRQILQRAKCTRRRGAL